MSRALFEYLKSGASLSVMALVAILSAPQALSQDSEDEAGAAAEEETKPTPTMRLQVSDRFEKAQVCLEEEDDIECAMEHIEYVEGIRDLSDYERGQLLNFKAFVAFQIDDVDGAIDAYEQLLALPREELPDGLIGNSMRNLATLYLGEDEMEKGLDLYIEWMNLEYITPASQDYYLLASIYYQLERFAEGIPAVTQAIELAKAKGELGEENWYVMLYVLHYEEEQFDEVIETLSILVENWPKWNHAQQLAGQLSERERVTDVLTIMEAAHGLGWLEKSEELVSLANLYMAQDTPYKAAVLLEDALEEGAVNSNVRNWRLLAQAWQYAAEHESALPALRRASTLADDGEVDAGLARSLARLARWEECVDASREALDRGGLDREDSTQMQLGQCLVNLRRYNEALAAFSEASEDDRSNEAARRWLAFVQTEIKREQANAEALASLENR